MPQGPGLVSYCIKKDLAALWSLWGAAPIDQGIMGRWVERVVGSASVRVSVFKRAQNVTSSFHFNSV